jgi:hypothetical protein
MRTTIGRSLASVGSFLLFVGGILHLAGGYPKVVAGVMASNLQAQLQSALRSVFLIAGWHWIVLAIVAAVAAFIASRFGRALVLICGFTVLVDGALMAAFLRWFIGTDMILLSSLLIFCGGLAIVPARRPLVGVAE